ncbi:lactonase family protein [Kitasatospora kifunensis]|uniref:6-phosphogluconolactonase (Cycloisomerase 2 family) n=1 Tax=Kitasatospora kifunensis TaxID=58351 RepID=A0A7W7RC48_KITKI|nr:lactonase family protein [Kitasatospora kifunensis]MBB4928676.1 6-phosphogluconolactonase (cycloisomerase 2 family) [Kitasatospora kifunensis]
MNHPPSTTTGGSLIIGSAAPARALGAGLSTVRYDGDGAMNLFSTLPVDHPSYAAVDPRRAVLHTVLEQQDGRVMSLRIDSGTGLQGPPTTAASGGAGPCHVAVHPSGSHVFAAHYGDGVLAVIPTDADGMVSTAGPVQTIRHPGRETCAELRDSTHAHMAAPSADGRFLLCTDLGTDRVYVYAFDQGAGRLSEHQVAQLPSGSGPRHLAFHPTNRHVYVLNELSSTLTVCAWDAVRGRIEPTAELETRQDPSAPNANSAAAVRLSADGRFLYTTNRGDDAIAVHAVHDDGASVELLTTVACGGTWPRDIALTPDGRLLFCANQGSDTLTAFHRDPSSGGLTPAGAPLVVTEPTSVLPVGP